MKEKKSIKINLKTYALIMFTILLVIVIALSYIFKTGKKINNRMAAEKNNYDNAIENVNDDYITEETDGEENVNTENNEDNDNKGFLQKKNNSNLLLKFKQDKKDSEETTNEDIETEEIINEKIAIEENENQEPINEEFVDESVVEGEINEEVKNYLETLGIDIEQEGLIDILGITP